MAKTGEAPFDEPRYYGIYRGVVSDNNDPKMLGRLVMRVPEVFGLDYLTDWATPKNGSIGGGYYKEGDDEFGRDKGDFVVPNLHDGVWVEFEAGDVRRPVWSGRWFAEPGAVSEIPVLAMGLERMNEVGDPDTSIQDVTSSEGIHPDTYEAVYPNNMVLKTKSGHIIEIDDTVDKTRIKVFHRSGTFIDIDNEGNVREKIVGSLWREIDGDVFELIRGKLHQKVEGDILRESDTKIIDNAPRIDHN